MSCFLLSSFVGQINRCFKESLRLRVFAGNKVLSTQLLSASTGYNFNKLRLVRTYTLVEVIITIAILSAVAIFPLTYLKDSVSGYNQMVRSARTASDLDNAVHYILRNVAECRGSGGVVAIDSTGQLLTLVTSNSEISFTLDKDRYANVLGISMTSDGETIFSPLLKNVKEFSIRRDDELKSLCFVTIVAKLGDADIRHEFSVNIGVANES